MTLGEETSEKIIRKGVKLMLVTSNFSFCHNVLSKKNNLLKYKLIVLSTKLNALSTCRRKIQCVAVDKSLDPYITMGECNTILSAYILCIGT